MGLPVVKRPAGHLSSPHHASRSCRPHVAGDPTLFALTSPCHGRPRISCSCIFFPARNWSSILRLSTDTGLAADCSVVIKSVLKMIARAMLCLITRCQLHTPGPHLDATILPFILLTQYDHSHQHILPDDSRSSSPRCGSHLTLRLHPSNSSSVLVSHILVRLLQHDPALPLLCCSSLCPSRKLMSLSKLDLVSKRRPPSAIHPCPHSFICLVYVDVTSMHAGSMNLVPPYSSRSTEAFSSLICFPGLPGSIDSVLIFQHFYATDPFGRRMAAVTRL